MKIFIGGKNGKEPTREVKNLAADIGVGVWNNDQAHHYPALVADHMSFRLEKNPD